RQGQARRAVQDHPSLGRGLLPGFAGGKSRVRKAVGIPPVAACLGPEWREDRLTAVTPCNGACTSGLRFPVGDAALTWQIAATRLYPRRLRRAQGHGKIS